METKAIKTKESKKEIKTKLSEQNVKYEYWIQGGCGLIRLKLELKNDKTFKMHFYKQWMGSDNYEGDFIGKYKFVVNKVKLEKYFKLHIKELNITNLATKKKETFKEKENIILIKIMLNSEPTLTKLESGEDEWNGMCGSWNKINDAVIVVVSNKYSKNPNVSYVCNLIDKCELTLITKQDFYIERDFFSLIHKEELKECENYKNFASVHIVFNDPCAVSNKIIEFLFITSLKEEEIPEILYVDGSGEMSLKPFENPKDFPEKPISTMTNSSENDFMRASHSSPYHLMKIIKTNKQENILEQTKFNSEVKRLELIMDPEFKKDYHEFKTNLNDSNDTRLFLTKACMDYQSMHGDRTKIVCQIGNKGEFDFGEVSCIVLKDRQRGLITALSSSLK